MLEEIDPEVDSYSFCTDTGLIYFVYFNSKEYDDHINEYPNLLLNGYGLGFYCTTAPAKKHDPKICTTIIKIISDFLKSQSKECVLLYHCDNSDGYQRKRNILFGQWYRQSAGAKMIKNSIEVVIDNGEEKKTSNYIGYITSEDNKYLEQIAEEFDLFATKLIAK